MKTKTRLSIVFLIAFALNLTGQGIIIDHNCTDVTSIPSDIIDSIKTNCKFEWAATSHGHQVLTGLKLVETEIPNLDVTVGDGETGYANGGYLPDPNGTFCVMDGVIQYFSNCKCCLGIAPNGYWQGANADLSMEKTLVQCDPGINISGWGWCTELNTWTASQVQEYFTEMEDLEMQYPDVQFIYSTGTTEYVGDDGYNRWIRNNQIRQYCIQNNKFLFDFADIECWSNGQFNYYVYNNDTVPLRHPDYNANTYHHTNALNCKNKGKAVWYMMALLCGWQNNNTNNPPQIDDQSFNVDENSPNVTIVGTVIATDPDAGQALTYSIINGNTDNAFQINSSSGELTVDNSSALDFETTPIFNLTIQVMDNGQGNLIDQAVVTVNLNDVNENPNIDDQAFNVDENSTNGTIAGTVIASDPDNGQTLTFTILSGNTDNAFQLYASSGELTVQNSAALNFETNPIFNLMVQVEDNGQGNLTDQATITINLTDLNEPPVIEPQDMSINLDAFFIFGDINNNIHSIGLVDAYDPDAGQSVSFSIVAGNGKEVWELDEFTGEILMVNPYRLNFIENFSYPLLIEVKDNSSQQLTSTAVVTIHVQLINLSEYFENFGLMYEETSMNSSGNLICKIYPNPSSNMITVDLENIAEGVVNFSVVNLNGEIVMEKDVLSGGDELKEDIDISKLSNGMYFINIQIGETVLYDRFIKL